MAIGVMIKGGDTYWAVVRGTQQQPEFDADASGRIQFPSLAGDNESQNLSTMRSLVSQKLREIQSSGGSELVVLRKLASRGRFAGSSSLYKTECIIQLVTSDLGISCEYVHPTAIAKKLRTFEASAGRSVESLFSQRPCYWTTGLSEAALLAWAVLPS